MTECEYEPVHKCSDVYRETPTMMSVFKKGEYHIVAGEAVRTGITRPLYKTRAVYQLHVGKWPKGGGDQEAIDGYWVYEGGRFYLSSEWHADPANIEPLEDKPTRKKRLQKAMEDFYG